MDGDRDASDEVLWRRVVNGDGDAFGALYDRHRDRVLGHALKIVRSAHTAEDVTAIVFYEAWRRRADVRIVNESILAWLLVTANHTIRNHTRQQRRYQHFLSQLPPPASSTDIAEEVAEADQRSSQAAALRAAFTQLKPLDRDVLTLCVVEEFSVREAATTLGVAEGTVKSRLHRAKARLGNLYLEVAGEHAMDDRPMSGRRTP